MNSVQIDRHVYFYLVSGIIPSHAQSTVLSFSMRLYYINSVRFRYYASLVTLPVYLRFLDFTGRVTFYCIRVV